MKKLITLLCCLALLLCGPMSAAAEAAFGEAEPAEAFVPLGEPSEYGEIPVLTEDTESELPLFLMMAVPEEPATEGNSELPSAYDVRNEIAVPEARHQGSWNTCWAVAAMGAMEITALKKGLTTENAATVNYSEWHLAYFLSHPSVDPLGYISDDYNTNMSRWINKGGNTAFSMMTLAAWRGVADETVTGMPYSDMSQEYKVDDTMAYVDALHLENAYAVDLSDTEGRSHLKTLLTEYGAAVLCLYYTSSGLYTGPFDDGEPEEEPVTEQAEVSEDGLPSEEEVPPESVPMEEPELAPESDSSEEEQLPEENIPEEDRADEEPEPELPEEENDVSEEPEPAAEEALDGSAEFGEEPEAVPAEDGEGDRTTCYYLDAIPSGTTSHTNHEVIVIGWDDNYPKENFAHSSKGITPPGDGAWLCRNSYGKTWGAIGGYFWVSYYDASVSEATKDKNQPISSRAVVFDVASAENYDNCYQNDGATILGSVTKGNIDPNVYYSYNSTNESVPNEVWYANVFTAVADPTCREGLSSVATYTYAPDVPYTVYVYTDLKDGADPTSGTKAATVSGTFTYAGFHTVSLNSPVELTEGTQFSVVVCVGTSSNTSLYVPACLTNTSWSSINCSEAGQSFVSHTGSGDWEDCYALTNQPNVRLKAYTVNLESPQTDTPDKWYEESMESLWAYGLFDDTEVTGFADGTATRAQAVDMLWRLAGKPAADKESFDDVSAGDEYYTAICWAAAKGIARGSDENADGIYSFRPDDPVTREECVTLLWRYAGSPKAGDALSSFGDADAVSSWALSAERWSVEAGIQTGLAGYGVYMLRPDYSLTLAQLAEFIVRFL